MRAFIGTFVSVENRSTADAFGARLAKMSNGVVRTIPPSSAHVTHVFLGDIDQSLARAVTEDLLDLMASVAPVPFQLGQPEVLRAGREPRLVLAPVDRGGQDVAAVTRRIVDRLRRHAALAGIPPPKHPHVTLARFGRGAGPGDAARVADLCASARDITRWHEDRLQSVELVRSDLTTKGPIYQVVKQAPVRAST